VRLQREQLWDPTVVVSEDSLPEEGEGGSDCAAARVDAASTSSFKVRVSRTCGGRS
jgi:hypothetical protein